ncbi:superinfection immunity protein [Puia sp.]|jgi:hypothetical protein|uniref:superinfection immunity protein n=1 Tax=Puia sp. TaxID=2045100 RepID=UPI002F40F760
MHAPTLLFWFFPFAFTWGIGAMLFIPYFLPTIIAILRKSSSTAGVFVLNFFLGWTFIGWIIALVWAIASRNNNTTVIVNNTYPINSDQPYGPPPPSYNPPPYSSEPSRGTQQTAPTLRRSSNQPGSQG